MQDGYDLYPSKYNFKYFTRLQSACSYRGKLQKKYAVLPFCDFKHRVILFTITDLGAVHMSRASPANRADLSHENLYFSTT